MQSSFSVRQIDELGRIVLPIEVRRALGWGEKTLVEIMPSKETGDVILRCHASTCVYCGSTEKLKEYRMKYICTVCQKELCKL